MKRYITKKTIVFLMVFILSLSAVMAFSGIALAEEVAVTITPKPVSDGEVGFWEDPVGSIGQGIVNSLSEFFLGLTIQMAGLIDLIIGLFKQLVGLDTVNIGDKPQSIVTYFLELEGINNVFLIFLSIGILLLFVFTIIQMARGMQNSEDGKLHPKKTFENFIKAIFNILMVPVVMIAFIFTTNVVMGEINTGMTIGLYGDAAEGRDLSYGGQVLLLMAKNNKEKLRLLDAEGWENYDTVGNPAFFESDGQLKKDLKLNKNSIIYKLKMPNGKDAYNYPNYTYMQMGNWNDKDGCYYIPTKDLNVFVGCAGALALLCVLVTCAFIFIKRLFDIILLYIVSPLIISTQPIDDGKRFSAWRDMLISKVLSAYAIIITLNLYFMIIPVVTINPGIMFFDGADNSIANGTLQLLFVIGGALALNGSNQLFSQLLGTGTMEHQQSMGAAAAMQSMVRAGAGIGIAGLKLGAKFGAGTAKHGIGTALGGLGYAGRAVGATRLGMGVKSWGEKVNGESKLGVGQLVSEAPTLGGVSSTIANGETSGASIASGGSTTEPTASELQSMSSLRNAGEKISVSKAVGLGIASSVNSAMNKSATLRGVKELGKGGIAGFCKNWNYVKNGLGGNKK